MELSHTFAEELTSLGNEVKPIKLINSRPATFNHNLSTDLNLPYQLQTAAHSFNALYADDGELNRCSVAQKYGAHQFGHWNPELGDGRGLL